METEQKNEKVRDFVSDKAFALWEKGLKERGFIVERGFNKLISPFTEMLEKRDGNYLVSTRHLALLHWSESFMLTWWE